MIKSNEIDWLEHCLYHDLTLSAQYEIERHEIDNDLSEGDLAWVLHVNHLTDNEVH